MNFTKRGSLFYQFRWFLLVMVAVLGLLVYADQSGWRFLSGQSKQQWNASGPGSHK